MTSNPLPAVIKKTVVGRAIHTQHTRQPIIPQQGTGYGSNYQPTVPANTKVNLLQRMPPNYHGGF